MDTITAPVCAVCARPCESDERGYPLGWTWHPEPVHADCCTHSETVACYSADGEDVTEREIPRPWGLVALAGGSWAVECKVCAAADRPAKWTVWGYRDGAERGLAAHEIDHVVGVYWDGAR